MATSSVKDIAKYNCLESHILIWLMGKCNSVTLDSAIQNKLRSIINYHKKFDNVDNCRQFMDGVSNERLVIITDEKFGKELVFTTEQWGKVSAVYVYCEEGEPSVDMSELKKHVRNIDTKRKTLEA